MASVEFERGITPIPKKLKVDVDPSKFSEIDRRVQEEVVRNQGATTTEISEATGIDRSKVDHSLGKLDKNGAVVYSKKKNVKRWFIDNKWTVAAILGISAFAVILMMQGASVGGLIGSMGEYKPEATVSDSPEAQVSQGIASPVVRESPAAGVGGLLGFGGKSQEVGEGGAGAQGFGATAKPTTFGGQTLEGDVVTGAGGTTIYQPYQEQRQSERESGWFSPNLGDIETGGQTQTVIGDSNIAQQQEAISQAGYISTQKAVQEAVGSQNLTPEQLAYLKAQGLI